MIWTVFGYSINDGKFDLPFMETFSGAHDARIALAQAQTHFGPLVKLISVVAGIHTSSSYILPTKEF